MHSYRVRDAAWQEWLRAFRAVPGRDAGAIDWYVERFPSYLAGMPYPGLLDAGERNGLRALFKDYAIELLKVQKKVDIRSYVDGAAIVAGVVATFWTPLGIPVTIFGIGVFVRNQLADRAWRRRRRDLERLAEWIQKLL